MHDERQRRLERLAGGPRGGACDDCPRIEEWTSLAAGLLDTTRRDELLEHAGQCDFCGATLRGVIEDLAEEMTEPQLALVNSLRSAQPDWQQDMARRLAAKPSVASRWWQWTLSPAMVRWATVSAGAILVLLGGWLALNQWISPDPARLLAQAYTQQRPFAFRIAGAEYSAVRQERGGGASAFDRPRVLLRAQDEIAGALEKDPDAARWLELRGRAEMLERDPEKAIATLQHALERKPGDPEILADLGAAYALRAQSRADRTVDYAFAIENLERSLRAKPNSREAAFNLALVYEEMNSLENAIAQWQNYLSLDSSGRWHDEARSRLAALEQKKKPAK